MLHMYSGSYETILIKDVLVSSPPLLSWRGDPVPEYQWVLVCLTRGRGISMEQGKQFGRSLSVTDGVSLECAHTRPPVCPNT